MWKFTISINDLRNRDARITLAGYAEVSHPDDTDEMQTAIHEAEGILLETVRRIQQKHDEIREGMVPKIDEAAFRRGDAPPVVYVTTTSGEYLTCPYCGCDFGETARTVDESGAPRCPKCRKIVQDGTPPTPTRK